MRAKNIKGLRFGKLIAIKENGSQNRKSVWLYRCDCGNSKLLRTSDVKSGKVKSCGCLLRQRSNLVGNRYGRLVVTKEVKPIHYFGKKEIRRWELLCDCGKSIDSDHMHITRTYGGTKSCGCKGREKLFKTKNTKHYRRLYNIWHKMRYRCENVLCGDYHKYGARGVRVMDEWLDFSKFYDDMIDTYQAGLTIERIDNDGNYCKDNCKWITNADQAKNRRTTVRVEGLCAKDYCKLHNISYQKFLYQKNNLGLEIADII